MRILVDADVLIDVALDRAPHAEAASKLLDRLERLPGTGFVAWHTLSNFYYLVSPAHGRAAARRYLIELARFIEVSPTTTESLRYAGELGLRDFEDALQVAAAKACGARFIATRNGRDYRASPIPALHPRDALARID
ncbi:MAG: PIN domain-containing protein [Planctomycetes bacterium]|nr:PIN domain-containing protein [Planctomycetota bacterium]